MRHPLSLLATLAVLLPVGLLAFSAPASAAIRHHRPHHVTHHQTLSHRVIHGSKHAFLHRHTRHPVVAG